MQAIARSQEYLFALANPIEPTKRMAQLIKSLNRKHKPETESTTFCVHATLRHKYAGHFKCSATQRRGRNGTFPYDLESHHCDIFVSYP